MRILYSLILSIFFCVAGYSQCIPDTSITHNDPGTYPDTVTNLPHAIVGQSYSTVIQVKVLTDSTVGGLTGTVDSIVIENVTGLPTGFTYACSPSGCSFPGGSDGCILLTGSAPTAPMIGSYSLVVQSTIYYKLFGTPQTLQNDITGYTIVIDATTGILLNEKASFIAGQNIPNPAKDFTMIPLNVMHAQEVTLSVMNLIGKKVLSHTYQLQRGKTNVQLDLHNLQPGIYMYSFSNGVNTVTRRMIITTY